MSKATNIPAVRITVDTHKDLAARQTPGAYYFFHGSDDDSRTIGMIHSCPCGCGALTSLNFDERRNDRPLWKVAGDADKLTLEPSIGIKRFAAGQDVEADGYHWHGWLREGVWVSA